MPTYKLTRTQLRVVSLMRQGYELVTGSLEPSRLTKAGEKDVPVAAGTFLALRDRDIIKIASRYNNGFSETWALTEAGKSIAYHIRA